MNLLLMRLIDEQYLRHPEYGSPRMTDWLISENCHVNHKRIARLMQTMGLQAITPGRIPANRPQATKYTHTCLETFL